tara:strand:+ start:289 stop:732 length:444 start_codon:yes stop_codon:yes gene_type:complete
MTQNQALLDFFIAYCNRVDLTIEQLYSKSKKRELVEKRMVLVYVLRKSIGMTFHNIANALEKNHATMIHAVKSIENFIKVYPHIQKMYDMAEECLIDHKQNLIEYYNSPILTEIERNKQLVDILLDNNDRLKLQIKQLKSELNGVKE